MDGFAEGGLLGGHLRPRKSQICNGSGRVETVLTSEQLTALKALIEQRAEADGRPSSEE